MLEDLHGCPRTLDVRGDVMFVFSKDRWDGETWEVVEAWRSSAMAGKATSGRPTSLELVDIDS